MSFRYVIIRIPATDSFKKQTLLRTTANYEGNMHFKENIKTVYSYLCYHTS